MSNVVYMSNRQAPFQNSPFQNSPFEDSSFQDSLCRSSSVPDSRADGGIRNVFFDQRCIRIERVVAGVKMRVAVPVAAYRGVVLTCEEKNDQRIYRVTLAHRDAEFSVTLHDATDWTGVLSIWQRWARFFAQPAIFNDDLAPGEKSPRVAASARHRRRSATLAKRRPRILLRRRQGRMGAPVNLLEGARELISYE